MAPKRKRYKSEVWQHFDESKEDNTLQICKYCNSQLVGGHGKGTKGLWNHLKSCKEKPPGVVTTGTHVPHLALLARELFRVAPTEAACERSFSHQKRVHRAERASLAHENVERELFVRLNYELFF